MRFLSLGLIVLFIPRLVFSVEKLPGDWHWVTPRALLPAAITGPSETPPGFLSSEGIGPAIKYLFPIGVWISIETGLLTNAPPLATALLVMSVRWSLSAAFYLSGIRFRLDKTGLIDEGKRYRFRSLGMATKIRFLLSGILPEVEKRSNQRVYSNNLVIKADKDRNVIEEWVSILFIDTFDETRIEEKWFRVEDLNFSRMSNCRYLISFF